MIATSSYPIEIQIDPAYTDAIAEQWLESIVTTVLRRESQPPNCSLTLVITDDERIQHLNRAYRDVDAPTDVLSFPAHEQGLPEDGFPAEPAFITPEDEASYLGDVVVSLPTAQAQAASQGHPVEQELALLVVHGCLHLLGYDHADEEQQAGMWERQDEILREIRAP